MQYLSSTLNVAINAVRDASRHLLRDFYELQFLQSSHRSTERFVQKSIERLEKELFTQLTKARPSFALFTSAALEQTPTSSPRNRWLVSSLEAKENFARGMPYFSVSIAVEEINEAGVLELSAGLIYAPALDALYFAQRGKGSWYESSTLNRHTPKQKLRVSNNADNIIVATTGNYTTPFHVKHNLRNFGSNALSLAYLAAGMVDACALNQASYTDLAAGLIIAQEAGAKLDPSFNSITLHANNSSLIVTNSAAKLD